MRKMNLDEQKVIELYEKYDSARPVAEAFGCSDESIYRVLKRHGIPRTHRRPKEKAKTANCRRGARFCPALIVQLDTIAKTSVREIAQIVGSCEGTVTRVLRQHGIAKYSSPVRKSDFDIDAIEREYLAGASSYELGEKYGVLSTTIGKWMRKRGHRLGKGSRSSKGGKACAKIAGELAIERRRRKFDTIADKVEYVSGTYGSTTVRCKTCGRTFWWDNKRMWSMDVPCPRCRGTDNESRHLEGMRRREERRQQREAAREWRLSVPHICKECGDPFYSERNSACYCSDACRKKANNRRRQERAKRTGVSRGDYHRRMRIMVTKETYDPSVTLAAVYKKHHGRCCECGRKTYRTSGWDPCRATLDHVIALANNGTHTWDNVQLLCSECNSRKRDLGQMRLAMAV